MHRSSPDNPSASAQSLQSSKISPRSTLISKNITVNGRRTSVRLEPAMWNALMDICRRERASTHVVGSAITEHKPAATSLTAAIRVFIMAYYRAAATEDGHINSGHGQGPATNAMTLLVQSVLDPNSMPFPSPYIIGKAYTPSDAGKQPLQGNLRRFPQRS